MRRLASCLGIVVVAVATASAQEAPAAKKSFDVASVKVAGPLNPQQVLTGQQRVGMKVSPGRVDIENWSIVELLNAAFKLSPARMTGPAAPKLANALTMPRFDIHATMPEGATKDDVPELLQSLLADRWKLAYHAESREQDVYALVVGKNGPKLTPSPEDPSPQPDAPANNTNRPDPISISGDAQRGMTIRGAGQAGAMKMTMSPDGTMRMEAEKLTMAQLADSLPQLVGKPVVDQTGMTGNYRVTIELTREDIVAAARAKGLNVPALPGGPAGGASDPGGGASIFRSIENMGLKLEPKKARVDYMVIDRLENIPSED